MTEIKHVKVYDTLYIGIKGSDKMQDGEETLAFMTYFDKDDTSFANRKRTIVTWCGTREKSYHDYFDNDPVKGFKIVGFDTRYSTSNKVFDIVDPRGFKLQISAKNLVHLIKTCVIQQGEIKGECAWGRYENNNVLLPTHDPLFAAGQKVAPTLKDLKVGDVISTAQADDIVYQGKKYVLGVQAEYPIKRGSQTSTIYNTVKLGKMHLFTHSIGNKHKGTKVEKVTHHNNRKYIRAAESPKIHICKTITPKSHSGNIAKTYELPEADRYFSVSNSIGGLGWSDNRVMYFDTKEEYDTYDITELYNYVRTGIERENESSRKRSEHYKTHGYTSSRPEPDNYTFGN